MPNGPPSGMAEDSLDFERLFKAAPAACMVLDRDLRIFTATDMYLETVQRGLDDLKGRYVFDAFPEQGERLERFRDAFQRAIGGEANSLVNVPFSIPVEENGGTVMREIWWTCHHNPVTDAGGTVRFMVQKALDVTRQVKAERLRDAIAAELQHRVANILTLVSVIAKRTAETCGDPDQFLARFEGRIQALAKTHSYLTGNNWDRMTIEKLVARQLSDLAAIDTGQIAMDGDRIDLNPAEAQILSLAIHELATNSVKHGALSSGTGRLAISWTAGDSGGYLLDWREAGIPAPAPLDGGGERKGFGSFILDVIVPVQLQAETLREFGEDGYHYRLSVAERTVPS